MSAFPKSEQTRVRLHFPLNAKSSRQPGLNQFPQCEGNLLSSRLGLADEGALRHRKADMVERPERPGRGGEIHAHVIDQQLG